MSNPLKISENGTIFSLGEHDGQKLHYDFRLIITYLDYKGKLLFGNHFRIYKKNRPVLRKLCAYIVGDPAACRAHNLDLDKGLLLCGPKGCGKTSLMSLVRYIVPGNQTFPIVSARNLVFAHKLIGNKSLADYENYFSYCFDGLGTESSANIQPKEQEVMGKLLQLRYHLYLSTGRMATTHLTTRLPAGGLQQYYGQHLAAAVEDWFNPILFRT